MKSQFLLLTTSYSREKLRNFQFNKIRKTYQLTYYFTRKITNFFRWKISSKSNGFAFLWSKFDFKRKIVIFFVWKKKRENSMILIWFAIYNFEFMSHFVMEYIWHFAGFQNWVCYTSKIFFVLNLRDYQNLSVGTFLNRE